MVIDPDSRLNHDMRAASNHVFISEFNDEPDGARHLVPD